MEFLNQDSIFQDIPLFAGLSDKETRLIKERSSFSQYKKGQVIYNEGAPADAFYCIVSGRVVIYTQDPYGNETILEYLHRGKFFGIISLLTGEPHSVTAKALNDCLLLVIKKEDFDFVLDKLPRLAIFFSQALSRRLKRKDIHQKTIFESTIISVFSSYSQVGKTIYALNLSLSLKKETHKAVIILDIVPGDKTHSLPRRLEILDDYKILDLSEPALDHLRALKDFILKSRFEVDLFCLFYKLQESSSLKKIVDILSLLVNDYHYIILDLPSYMEQNLLEILNQSDIIHILTSPEPVDLERTRHLIERLKTDFHFQESKINVVTNEYKLSKLTHEQQLDLLSHEIFATLPKIDFGASDRLILDEPACEYARAVRRVSRQLGERQVGLALGVGVAYGFCHIGVLKVIEEENIPIDIITGSSVGALIASLWVSGKSSKQILQIAMSEFKELKYIWSVVDLTFPWLGFIKGNKLYNFLKKYLGNKTFYDTRIPLRIVVSDIKRKEPRIFDKGLLADAIMASCSMPGIFRPFRSKKEELLLDGGVIHPLPTEALFKMGVRKVIAVNVTPSREDILKQYDKIQQELSLPVKSPKKKDRFDLKRYFRNKFRNNILDLIFSSIEMMQSEMAEKEGQLADVLLHPDTSGMYWLELHKAEEFARRGEGEARRNLDKIWQIVNE